MSTKPGAGQSGIVIPVNGIRRACGATGKTLYRHCRLEYPEPFITDGRLGLPKKAHLAIVDHEMCAICDPDRITAGAA